MNIFYVHFDPGIAARSLCDKHVVKMVLESAQMLCTAHRVLDGVVLDVGCPDGAKLYADQRTGQD